MASQTNTSVAALAVEIRGQVLAAKVRSVPTLRKTRRAASRRVKTLAGADVVRLAMLLRAAGDVPKWLPYEIVHHHREAMQSLDERQLRRLGGRLSAWDEVDPFACYLSGPAGCAKRRLESPRPD